MSEGHAQSIPDDLFVKTRKSILDAGALARVIEAEYDLSSTPEVRLHRISGSDVYRVIDGDRDWFLKVYRSTDRDSRRAADSVRALDLLSQHGFAVPRPVYNRRGDLVVGLQAVEGRRAAYMYEAVHGEAPINTDPKHGFLFGTTAARLHLLMDEVATPDCFKAIDYDYLFERYIHGIERFLGHEESAIQFLRRLAQALWHELNHRLPQNPPQFGFCHGDMHTGNAVLKGSDRLFLLDFDACGYGWRVMDIGTYYVSYDWMGLDDESQQKRRQVRAHFLRGYNSIRQISAAEYEMLDLFMAIRHFELLGIGMGRVPFTGAHWVNSKQLHAYVAWFRTWLGSCEWFARKFGT